MKANRKPVLFPCSMCWDKYGEAVATTPESCTPEHQAQHAIELRAGFPKLPLLPDEVEAMMEFEASQKKGAA